jgi:hypothetical protein
VLRGLRPPKSRRDLIMNQAMQLTAASAPLKSAGFPLLAPAKPIVAQLLEFPATLCT